MNKTGVQVLGPYVMVHTNKGPMPYETRRRRRYCK